MTDDWDITTGDGSVTLYLPPDFSAELDARTSDGGIRNELPGRIARRKRTKTPAPGATTATRTAAARSGAGSAQAASF